MLPNSAALRERAAQKLESLAQELQDGDHRKLLLRSMSVKQQAGLPSNAAEEAALRSVMEQHIQRLPENDPRKRILLESLGVTNPPPPPEAVSPVAVDAAWKETVEQSLQQAHARLAAVMEELQRVTAEHIELRTITNQVLNLVHENTKLLKDLPNTVLDIVTSPQRT